MQQTLYVLKSRELQWTGFVDRIKLQFMYVFGERVPFVAKTGYLEV